jgi:7-cyano-7-deazaguanine synthase
MKIEKSIIILSGGLDSSILMYEMIDKPNIEVVAAICFDYGQRHKKEIECAKYLCDVNDIPLKVIDLGFFKDLTQGGSALTDNSIDVPTAAESLGDSQALSYVPNRNMMMLSIAVSYAESVGAENVFYGAGGDDEHSGYWDCTKEFLENINKVISLNRKNKIQICAPYVNLSKKEIVKRGMGLKVPFENTWTCYNGRDKSCGKCITCSNRIKSFIMNGLQDSLPYEVDIPWEKLIEKVRKGSKK